ncbi:MAG: TlpA family protein disulfide reductase, partial [Rubrobacteraceae bacterium]
SSQSGGNAQNFTPDRQGLLPVGSKAPDFTVKTIDGGKGSLGGNNSKSATLLVLFASWCPHCQAEAPTISSLEKKYPDLRVVMVSIPDKKAGWERGDNLQNVRKFVNTYYIKGPAAYDPAVGRTYKVSGTPTIYVLDKNGKIVASNTGETPAGVLEDWVQKALG